MQKSKTAVWGGLKNSCEKKGREINRLNAELQRLSGRENRAFLREQCKEMEENNRIGKTIDLFKKIRDMKGNISGEDGHNKGQK